MGIVPRDPDRPSSPPDRILGRNGEETAKTQRAQTALEIPIPKQVALLADPKPTFGRKGRNSPDAFTQPRYVFSADSKTLGRVGERPYVPEQSQDGQKRELSFCHISCCARVVSGDSPSRDRRETGPRKRLDHHSLPLPWTGPFFSSKHRCHNPLPDQHEADVREGSL